MMKFFVVRVSVGLFLRVVVAFLIFSAIVLCPSCAVGDVSEEKASVVEDGPIRDPDTGRSPFDNTFPSNQNEDANVSSSDRPPSNDVGALWPDVPSGPDALSVLTVALDGGEPPLDTSSIDVLQQVTDANILPSPDAPRFVDVVIPTSDVSSVPEVGTLRDVPPEPVDIPIVPPLDVPRPDVVMTMVRDVPIVDLGSPPIDLPMPRDVVTPPPDNPPAPPPVRELCNDRDDDGNGLVDEIFECRIGRRGGTCVTVCGANGYQICTNTCRWDMVCQTYPENCADTIDNDCNRLVDCADPACAADPICRPVAPLPPPPPPPPPDAGPPVIDSGSPVVDAGRTDGCHDLVIRLDPSRLSRCVSGWVAIVYDNEGHPHESAPGGTLTFTICGRLRGQLVISTRCGGDYLLDWPGVAGRPAREGGITSITVDGSELSDAESLLCLDRWSPTPGIRPIIPLESYYYGRCP